MKDGRSEMHDMDYLFSALSEKNKDVLILAAKNLQAAQKTVEQSCKQKDRME